MLILCAVGAGVCGAVSTGYQVKATGLQFTEMAVFLLTAILALSSMCKNKCMIGITMSACIISTLMALGGLVYYSSQIYQLSVSQADGSVILGIVCGMAFINLLAFITALTGSVYCCTGLECCVCEYCVCPTCDAMSYTI
eukprot:XP_011667143.1 PREDICTED: uncharacterized protein LOC105439636 [Strongylocentrotus purpuratus]